MQDFFNIMAEPFMGFPLWLVMSTIFVTVPIVLSAILWWLRDLDSVTNMWRVIAIFSAGFVALGALLEFHYGVEMPNQPWAMFYGFCGILLVSGLLGFTPILDTFEAKLDAMSTATRQSRITKRQAIQEALQSASPAAVKASMLAGGQPAPQPSGRR